MKVLTFTSLFPNSMQPRHGIFVENRLKRLRELHPEVEIRVVAPVPWFPFRHTVFGEYGTFAGVEARADREWAQVLYPRYPTLPKIGMNIAPWLMARACHSTLQGLIRDGFDFDILDAHYFYPDGVAAAMLARWLGKPLICTARGNDISLFPQFAAPRRMIGDAISACDAVVAVCQALADEILRLGYAPRRIEVLRNGVDLELFKPVSDRAASRQRLGFDRFTILSVGSLIERKGHHCVIDALMDLPDCQLVIVGDGPMKKQLVSQTASLGLMDRVRFEGTVRHYDLPEYYSAADVMVLASSREGWANVLLESMACGTPVVATNVWGTPEVVNDTAAGILVERAPDAIGAGIREIRAQEATPDATRAYAERYSWDDTSDKLFRLFQTIANSRPPA